jgi:hypothetical protein
MRSAAFLAPVVFVVACDAPPLKIVYEVSGGAGQCKKPSGGSAESCLDVPMRCDAVLSLRIVDPGNPTIPYVTVCKDVIADAPHDLCSIAAIDLPEGIVLPKKTLEIQVLVWPRDAVTDPSTKMLDCLRNEVVFEAADGFPITTTPGAPSPAFGGHTYFHPGDTETVVTLGCTDPQSVNDSTCAGTPDLVATSTVIDFDTRVPVSPDEGDGLSVAVGTPEPSGTDHVLDALHLHQLPRVVRGPPPVWKASINNFTVTDTACIAVLEDIPFPVTALHCVPTAPGSHTLDIQGIRLTKPSLQQILNAVGGLPASGMTIGIVVDQQNNALTGVPVSSPGAAIKYLTASRDALVANGMATTSSGVFVSLNADYGATFTATSGFKTATALAGRVMGKVTIALLQFSDVVGQ